METILAIMIAFYLIAVIILIIQKKIDSKSNLREEDANIDKNTWEDDNEDGHRWMNFSIGLSVTPTSEFPDRPRKR
jgi:hypothetical protein